VRDYADKNAHACIAEPAEVGAARQTPAPAKDPAAVTQPPVHRTPRITPIDQSLLATFTASTEEPPDLDANDEQLVPPGMSPLIDPFCMCCDAHFAFAIKAIVSQSVFTGEWSFLS
jgi:hypothetical protein